jgi:PST family polysaccharide transporter
VERGGGKDIAGRAAAGAAVVGVRAVAVRLIGLAGLFGLARLLGPSDFGVAALGAALTTALVAMMDQGLGASLIRRSEAPAREDLEALVALNLAATAAIVALAYGVGAPFGTDGIVVATMMAALPVTAFRSPPMVRLERALSYHPVALVELTETATYYGVAVVAVAAGLGLWGVVLASGLRCLLGTTVAVAVGPGGPVRPRWNGERVRRMLGFGARFQAVGATNLLRDQGLNLGIAAIAGTATLGLWNLGYRILQAPLLAVESLLRVSYPAMAQLLSSGSEARRAIERGAALMAVGLGALLAPLAACAHWLVPVVFGSGYAAAADVVPLGSLALIIVGPVVVGSAGYLYAAGQAATMLRVAIVYSIVWAAIAFALLPVVGVVAVGIGWAFSAVVEAVMVGARTRTLAGARLPDAVLWPVCLTVLAAGAGALAAATLDASDAVRGVAGGVLAALVYAAGVATLRRGEVRELWRWGTHAVRGARRFA